MREVPQESGAGVIAGIGEPFTVAIRRNIGRPVRPEAEQLDGKVFIFRMGWLMDEDEPYPGEQAWVPNDFDWPADAPSWIAAGDLKRYEASHDD